MREIPQSSGKKWLKITKLVFYVLITIALSLMSFFILASLLNITSSNAVLYFVKDIDGGLKITNDLHFNEANRLLFMLDASCVLSFFEGLASAVSGKPILELTWDREKGNGVIKEYRPDGTKFLVVLSRYSESEGIPRGIFIGGDLPYGDIERWLDKGRNNTGMAYYDGEKWQHIWCSINEAMTVKDFDNLSIGPWKWKYLGSKVLKFKSSEIILESLHEIYLVKDGRPINLLMKRIFSKKAGLDYVILRIEITNIGNEVVYYNYSFGDEPWVGEFGSSIGDVGWGSGKVYRFESYVSPLKNKFIGMWDYGNSEAGEPQRFSNFANFIEWIDNPPTVVYFSNSFIQVDENKPLNSFDNRVLNLLWLYQFLLPGQTNTYTLALGMAKPEPTTGLPIKPDLILSEVVP